MRFLSAALGAACAAALILTALSARGEGAAVPPTERETQLFNALDLSRPGLAKVKAAWDRKDAVAARRAFATYLRNRTDVHWGKATDGSPLPAFSPDDRAHADAAAEGRVKGGLVPLEYAFPNGEIDWHFNATEHVPGQAVNNEWQWQLNRVAFWGDLAVAYRATGDEKYAQAFARQLRSWIAQCPMPDHLDGGVGSCWRTIEAGIRMAWAWPGPFFAFVRSPPLTDADLVALAGAFLDHGRYLRKYNTRLNFLTMEMDGLYCAGSVFPEFKESAEWRAYAAGRLAEEAHSQFLPDGAHLELSTGYHNVALDNIARVAEVARWNDRTAELPASYLAPLEQSYAWQLVLMTPERTLPKFNDSWLVTLKGVFKRAATAFPGRTDFRWVATDGAEGTPPAWTSAFLDWSGFAVMREGWQPDSNCLVFRVGPLGAGHQHQDGLDVLLWPYGRELLFSGGGGSYEQSKWRKWAVSSFAANCVIVDGLEQNRAQSGLEPKADPNRVSQSPIDAQWQSTPVFDQARGTYDQDYGPKRVRPAVQHRDVLFLKPDLYIVADFLVPNDAASHQYQARWQLLTTRTQIDAKTKALATTDPGVPNLVVAPLRTDGLAVASASAQEEPEILGWNVRKDLDPPRLPATTLLHSRSGKGPQTFLTLFVPLRPGQTNPVASVQTIENGAGGTTVRLADGRRLRVSATASSGIEVEETLPDGTAGRTVRGKEL